MPSKFSVSQILQESATVDFGLKLSPFSDCNTKGYPILKNGEEFYEEIITSFDAVSFCFSF